LVYEALSKETRQLPGLDLAADKIKDRRCLTFEVLWANPGPGSVHVDFYTVDLKTVALWRGVICRPVKDPKVERLRRELRRRLGLGSDVSDRDGSSPCCH
jgi:hypothetical protein